MVFYISRPTVFQGQAKPETPVLDLALG
jgi:hypothetical protein